MIDAWLEHPDYYDEPEDEKEENDDDCDEPATCYDNDAALDRKMERIERNYFRSKGLRSA